ncbi:MAG: M56 family metallopeptidase [Bacteroidota bacterium]
MMHLSHALGWTILHSLWQGLLVWAIYGLLKTSLRNFPPQSRYLLGLGAMMTMFVWTVATFYTTYQDARSTDEMVVYATEMTLIEAESLFFLQAETWEAYLQEGLDWVGLQLQPYVGWVSYAWLLGFVFFSLRWGGGWWYLHRLSQQYSRKITGPWSQRMAQMAIEMGIRKQLLLKESGLIDSPMVIGYVKPVVLLPLGMLSGITPRQMEAILAHELAHIRRHDFLINIIQTFTEVLFFYHPFYRRISNQVNAERENCCDDIAVASCGDPVMYAHTLTDLAEHTLFSPPLSLRFNGNTHHLMDRITRIIRPERVERYPFARLSMSLMIVLGMLSLAWFTPVEAEPTDLEQIVPDVQVEETVPEVQVDAVIVPVTEAVPLPETAPEPEVMPDPQEKSPVSDIDQLVASVLSSLEMAWDTPPPPPPPSPRVEPRPRPSSEPRVEPSRRAVPRPQPAPRPTAPVMPEMPAMPEMPDLSAFGDWEDLDEESRDRLKEEMAEFRQQQAAWQREYQQAYDEYARSMKEQHVYSQRQRREMEAQYRNMRQQARDRQKADLENVERDYEQSLRMMERQLRELKRLKSLEELSEVDKQEMQQELQQLKRELSRRETDRARAIERAMKELKMETERMQVETEREVRRNQQERAREYELRAREMERMNQNMERKIRDQRAELRDRFKGLKSELRAQLKRDGLLKNDKSKITLKVTSSSIKANGRKVPRKSEAAYRRILKRYGISSDGQSSFSFDND